MDKANKHILSDMKAQGASDNEITRLEVGNTNLKKSVRQKSLSKLHIVYDETTAVDKATAKSKVELGDQILKIEGYTTNDYIDVFCQTQ